MLRYPNDGFATSNQAVYMLFRRGNELAFVKRANTGWMDGHYGLPSGRVDEGESYTTAAIREAHEEIGAILKPTNIRPVLMWQRHHDDGDWADVVFEALQWEGELYNAEPDKHDELAWLDVDNLPDNVIPEVRAMLEQVAAGSTLFEYGWDSH